MVRMVWMTVALLVACRDYQEDLPFEDCQPYILECALCTFDDDVLADIAAAHRRVETRHASGAVIVTMKDRESTADQ